MIKRLAQYIIRPQRSNYDVDADLGYPIFERDNKRFYREDIEDKLIPLNNQLNNARGQRLKCSVFSPLTRMHDKYNCVIYAHGNSGNRCSIFECFNFLLEADLVAVSFDFTGCGQSDGEYVTLGAKEVEDLRTVVAMGAVTTLLYAAQYDDVCAIACDSPFSDLKTLLYDFIHRYNILGETVGDSVYEKVRQYIKQETQIDLESVSPRESASKIRCPVTLVHARDDSIILCRHSDIIAAAITAPRRYFQFNGDHNDLRSVRAYREITEFLVHHLNRTHCQQYLIQSCYEQLDQTHLESGVLQTQASNGCQSPLDLNYCSSPIVPHLKIEPVYIEQKQLQSSVQLGYSEGVASEFAPQEKK